MRSLHDPTLQTLSTYVLNKWPSKTHQIDQLLTPYYKQQTFSTRRTYIKYFIGSKIVIPKALRKRIIEILHVGHRGIEQTKINVRRTIF